MQNNHDATLSDHLNQQIETWHTTVSELEHAILRQASSGHINFLLETLHRYLATTETEAHTQEHKTNFLNSVKQFCHEMGNQYVSSWLDWLTSSEKQSHSKYEPFNIYYRNWFRQYGNVFEAPLFAIENSNFSHIIDALFEIHQYNCLLPAIISKYNSSFDKEWQSDWINLVSHASELNRQAKENNQSLISILLESEITLSNAAAAYCRMISSTQITNAMFTIPDHLQHTNGADHKLPIIYATLHRDLNELIDAPSNLIRQTMHYFKSRNWWGPQLQLLITVPFSQEEIQQFCHEVTQQIFPHIGKHDEAHVDAMYRNAVMKFLNLQMNWQADFLSLIHPNLGTGMPVYWDNLLAEKIPAVELSTLRLCAYRDFICQQKSTTADRLKLLNVFIDALSPDDLIWAAQLEYHLCLIKSTSVLSTKNDVIRRIETLIPEQSAAPLERFEAELRAKYLPEITAQQNAQLADLELFAQRIIPVVEAALNENSAWFDRHYPLSNPNPHLLREIPLPTARFWVTILPIPISIAMASIAIWQITECGSFSCDSDTGDITIQPNHCFFNLNPKDLSCKEKIVNGKPVFQKNTNEASSMNAVFIFLFLGAAINLLIGCYLERRYRKKQFFKPCRLRIPRRQKNHQPNKRFSDRHHKKLNDEVGQNESLSNLFVIRNLESILQQYLSIYNQTWEYSVEQTELTQLLDRLREALRTTTSLTAVKRLDWMSEQAESSNIIAQTSFQEVIQADSADALTQRHWQNGQQMTVLSIDPDANAPDVPLLGSANRPSYGAS